MKKNKKWMRAVILGFLTVYLLSMGLSTCLVAFRYQEEFRNEFLSKRTEAYLIMQDNEKKIFGKENPVYQYSWSQFWLGNLLNSGSGYQQFSAAFYDSEGGKIAEAGSSLRIFCNYSDQNLYEPLCWPAADFLTEEEIKKLAEYYFLNYQHAMEEGGSEDAEAFEEYRFTAYVNNRSWKPVGIAVQKIRWEKEGTFIEDPLTGEMHFYTSISGSNYGETEGEIVWQWGSTESPGGENWMYTSQVDLDFPYIHGPQGDRDWMSWEKNAYLHEFPEQTEFSIDGAYDSLTENKNQRRTYVQYAPEGEEMKGFMILREDSHPWLAALNDMKSVYLVCLLLILVCAWKVIGVTEQVYRQQAVLEEDRRDFTNAMAHELKTPLGVIRGFAENLLEGIHEEKREYYLKQIVGQTEEMDRLADEMITLSRLDSAQLVLQKEQVELGELVQEEFSRFEFQREAKHIHFQYEEEDAFVIQGDKNYLLKAVRNLLSNAVAYNQTNGFVWVKITSDTCIIGNTAAPLSEEQLAHAFEMFYQGDESRSGRNRGLGLYLTEKILRLHGLSVEIGNLPEGVQVVIRKEDSLNTSRQRKGIGCSSRDLQRKS